jgi:peroxiredoxin
MKSAHIVAAGLLALAAAAPTSAQVLRESSGQRRADLDRRELTPFSFGWSSLTDWANGEALSAATTDGNVVLIFTWANWNPASTRVVPTVERLWTENQGKGLVVVGVHHDEGWEGAAEGAQKAGLSFRYARDAGNNLRMALNVDQDPDFYLIDRAGQIRYADIQTASLSAAVAELVGETREQAADLPALLKKRQSERDAEARRTGQIRQGIDIANMPEVTFPKPRVEIYSALEWPDRWTDFEKDRLQIQQYNYGGQAEPKTLILPTIGGEVHWFDAPPNLNGRAIVLYFWAPDVSYSYAKVQPQMERLQRAKGRDIAVMGVVMPKRDTSGNQPNAAEIEKQRQHFVKMIEAAKAKQRYNHANLVDPDGAVVGALLGNNNTNVVPAPLAAIFSTDLQLRWIGDPTDSRFDAALEQVLRVDPAVQARRLAEQEYIRTHGG